MKRAWNRLEIAWIVIVLELETFSGIKMNLTNGKPLCNALRGILPCLRKCHCFYQPCSGMVMGGVGMLFFFFRGTFSFWSNFLNFQHFKSLKFSSLQKCLIFKTSKNVEYVIFNFYVLGIFFQFCSGVISKRYSQPSRANCSGAAKNLKLPVLEDL